uniref:Fibronectin type-III domain-containing protein n=1 Tax=Syphacia muris TaxID=451379 RepID=A0A0N5AD35_9BILA
LKRCFAGALPRARFRRNVGTLLVTWQDVVDRNINSNGLGYLVEYKTTDGDKWIVYPSVVPYAENNALREIKIENLDSDASYQVRVKLVGKNGETIALSDGYTTAVWKDSSKCQQNEVSAPKAVKVRETTKYTLTVEFERPECGYPTSYVIEVSCAAFIARSPGTIIDLLPNTEYKIRVRAADSNHTERPWSETITASTVGDMLGSITTDYRTNSEIRISWPIEYNEDLHKYKVTKILVKPSLTLDIKPTQNSALFTNLMPDTEYAIGVVAYGAAEPVFYYRASVKTASNNAMLWDDKPKINEFAPNIFSLFLKCLLSVTVISNDNQFTLDMVADDDTTFNSIRILAIDDQNRLVLKTPEVTRIGTVVVEPCTGYAGIPKNINYQFISDNAVQFSWDKPKCESWGPMTGYEYQVINLSQNDDDQLESFVTDPVVVQGELKPDSEYSFRVRSRIGTVHSPWSDEITALKHFCFSSVNLYRLRFITQPRSYLVWTPLTEDLERVTHFKLSYKEEGSDEWTEIVETPDSFKCPNDITFDVADYCYELSDPAIKTGVQYTANVIHFLYPNNYIFAFFIVLYPILIGNIHLTRNGHQTEIPEESAWRQIIGPIYHEPLRQSYGVELPRFGTDDYLIRILAVDDKGEVLATSPSYHSTSRCQVPSTAPTVRLEDSEEGIKAQWVYDEPVNEECHLRFLLSGHNNQKSFEFIVPGNSREFNFGQYNGGDWEVRVQAINSADSGPMSDSAALRRTAEGSFFLRFFAFRWCNTSNMQLI